MGAIPPGYFHAVGARMRLASGQWHCMASSGGESSRGAMPRHSMSLKRGRLRLYPDLEGVFRRDDTEEVFGDGAAGLGRERVQK
jgi:hypothetical protein